MKRKSLLFCINTIAILIVFISLFILNKRIEGFAASTVAIPSATNTDRAAALPSTLFTSTNQAGTATAPTSGKGNIYSVPPTIGSAVPNYAGSSSNIGFANIFDFASVTNTRLSVVGPTYANLAINYATTTVGTVTENSVKNDFQSYLIAVNDFIDDNLIPGILNQGAADTTFTPDLNVFTYLPGTYWLTSSQITKLNALIPAFNRLTSPDNKRNAIKQAFLIMKSSLTGSASQSELFDLFNTTLSNYLSVPQWIHSYYENGDVPSFATQEQKNADAAVVKSRTEYNKVLKVSESKISSLPPPANIYNFYTPISTSSGNQILDALQKFTEADLNNRIAILTGKTTAPSKDTIDNTYLYIGIPLGVVILGLIAYIFISKKSTNSRVVP